MSREILFRAKSIYQNVWIEGDLFHHLSKTHILNDKGRYQVDPSTVCQYTGLPDGNGVKIWENDICEVTSEDGLFLVEWDADTARFVLNGDGLTIDFDNVYDTECEIKGNYFDDPELLEGGTGGCLSQDS